MKKTLALIIIMLCTMSLLTGCKKDKNEVSNQVEEIESLDRTQTDNSPAENDNQTALAEIKGLTVDDVVTLPFQTEVVYNPEDYPDLAKKGTMPRDDIDNMEEAFGDYLYYSSEEFSNQMNGRSPAYCDKVYQYFLCGADSPTQIVSVDVSNGNERMDKIMKDVGYQIYHLTYFYPYGLFDTSEMSMIKPLSASLEVKGTQYQYEFYNDELVRRYEEENFSDNPATNDFLNSIYKIGCYYGNVLVGEKDEYTLLIDEEKNVTKIGDKIYLECCENGFDTVSFVYVIDENTAFEDVYDLYVSDDFKRAESPLAYFGRLCDNKEQYGEYLLGRMHVEVSGNHINVIKSFEEWY